jgi:hypothetical protein
MKRGIDDYNDNLRGARHSYRADLFPIQYGRMLEEHEMYQYNELPQILIDLGVLLKDENEPKEEQFETTEEYYEAFGDYHDEQGKLWKKYNTYKERIVKPYYIAWCEKQYISYCICGGCHWCNPTFGLELAKMLMPHVKWIVKEGETHTTVTTKEEDLVFDILMYAEKDEETLGGSFALSEANTVCYCKTWLGERCETCVKEEVVEVLKS